MASLKHEMREMFEKRNAMDYYNKSSRFEDGLLEKIVNVAFKNLRVFDNHAWHIGALRSPLALQRLYRILGDSIILDASIALLIIDHPIADDPKTSGSMGVPIEASLSFLLMSLTYAAKYYCIDFYKVPRFKGDEIAREFALEKNRPIRAVVCLGCFGSRSEPEISPSKPAFSAIVCEISGK